MITQAETADLLVASISTRAISCKSEIEALLKCGAFRHQAQPIAVGKIEMYQALDQHRKLKQIYQWGNTI